MSFLSGLTAKTLELEKGFNYGARFYIWLLPNAKQQHN